MFAIALRGGSAVLLTTLVFLGMASLISLKDVVMGTESSIPTIKLTRVERAETSEKKKTEQLTQPEQQILPPPPAIVQQLAKTDASNGVAVDDLVIATDEVFKIPTDRRATPIVRFPPEYPQRALMRNVEGWVMMEFTITSSGTVADIVVIDADPPGYFEKAAEKSLSRWKYQPKMVNGKPVSQLKMQELFKFEIK